MHIDHFRAILQANGCTYARTASEQGKPTFSVVYEDDSARVLAAFSPAQLDVLTEADLDALFVSSGVVDDSDEDGSDG